MEEELKRCPFCGAEVTYMSLATPMKMFYCQNYRNCGAIVSFDNPYANRFEKARLAAWNRRVNDDI